MAAPAPGITREEFAGRRRRAVAAAREAGLDGLLVCARGGGALDRYGDVLYLANHYSSFPFIPDLPGSWTGRAHSFLLLPVDAEPTIVVDIPSVEAIALPADRIVVADLVIEETVAVLRRDLPRGRIGLVGHDTIPASILAAFEAALPEIAWVPADAILAGLRAVKSPAEIDKLRAASRLGSRTVEAMMAAARPGASHGDLVAAGLAVLVPAGGILYNSFMASGRGGASPRMVRHTFPTWGAAEPLAAGDWLRIGISGILDGYCFDLSRSRSIGPAAPGQVEAFEAAIAIVRAGIAAIRVGATAGEVAEAGTREQDRLGFPYKGVFSGLGHGLGLGWDAPWLVPGDPTELRPGMVFSVEKTVMKDGHLGDFEESVVLTEAGTELITDAPVRLW